jgi:hypothetical protein
MPVTITDEMLSAAGMSEEEAKGGPPSGDAASQSIFLPWIFLPFLLR